MSNEEISTVAEKIVEAVNKTTNDYDAKEKVSEILKKKNFRIEHVITDYKDNVRCIISTNINV